MNKELEEKIISQIKTINLHPEEIVVLYYNKENLSLDSLAKIYKLLKEFIPNKLLAIPEEISLQSLDKESLIKMRDNLNQIIEFGDIKKVYH